jgi:hypothetical protein
MGLANMNAAAGGLFALAGLLLLFIAIGLTVGVLVVWLLMQVFL